MPLASVRDISTSLDTVGVSVNLPDAGRVEAATVVAPFDAGSFASVQKAPPRVSVGISIDNNSTATALTTMTSADHSALKVQLKALVEGTTGVDVVSIMLASSSSDEASAQVQLANEATPSESSIVASALQRLNGDPLSNESVTFVLPDSGPVQVNSALVETSVSAQHIDISFPGDAEELSTNDRLEMEKQIKASAVAAASVAGVAVAAAEASVSVEVPRTGALAPTVSLPPGMPVASVQATASALNTLGIAVDLPDSGETVSTGATATFDRRVGGSVPPTVTLTLDPAVVLGPGDRKELKMQVADKIAALNTHRSGKTALATGVIIPEDAAVSQVTVAFANDGTATDAQNTAVAIRTAAVGAADPIVFLLPTAGTITAVAAAVTEPVAQQEVSVAIPGLAEELTEADIMAIEEQLSAAASKAAGLGKGVPGALEVNVSVPTTEGHISAVVTMPKAVSVETTRRVASAIDALGVELRLPDGGVRTTSQARVTFDEDPLTKASPPPAVVISLPVEASSLSQADRAELSVQARAAVESSVPGGTFVAGVEIPTTGSPTAITVGLPNAGIASQAAAAASSLQARISDPLKSVGFTLADGRTIAASAVAIGPSPAQQVDIDFPGTMEGLTTGDVEAAQVAIEAKVIDAAVSRGLSSTNASKTSVSFPRTGSVKATVLMPPKLPLAAVRAFAASVEASADSPFSVGPLPSGLVLESTGATVTFDAEGSIAAPPTVKLTVAGKAQALTDADVASIQAQAAVLVEAATNGEAAVAEVEVPSEGPTVLRAVLGNSASAAISESAAKLVQAKIIDQKAGVSFTLPDAGSLAVTAAAVGEPATQRLEMILPQDLGLSLTDSDKVQAALQIEAAVAAAVSTAGIPADIASAETKVKLGSNRRLALDDGSAGASVALPSAVTPEKATKIAEAFNALGTVLELKDAGTVSTVGARAKYDASPVAPGMRAPPAIAMTIAGVAPQGSIAEADATAIIAQASASVSLSGSTAEVVHASVSDPAPDGSVVATVTLGNTDSTADAVGIVAALQAKINDPLQNVGFVLPTAGAVIASAVATAPPADVQPVVVKFAGSAQDLTNTDREVLGRAAKKVATTSALALGRYADAIEAIHVEIPSSGPVALSIGMPGGMALSDVRGVADAISTLGLSVYLPDAERLMSSTTASVAYDAIGSDGGPPPTLALTLSGAGMSLSAVDKRALEAQLAATIEAVGDDKAIVTAVSTSALVPGQAEPGSLVATAILGNAVTEAAAKNSAARLQSQISAAAGVPPIVLPNAGQISLTSASLGVPVAQQRVDVKIPAGGLTTADEVSARDQVKQAFVKAAVASGIAKDVAQADTIVLMHHDGVVDGASELTAAVMMPSSMATGRVRSVSAALDTLGIALDLPQAGTLRTSRVKMAYDIAAVDSDRGPPTVLITTEARADSLTDADKAALGAQAQAVVRAFAPGGDASVVGVDVAASASSSAETDIVVVLGNGGAARDSLASASAIHAKSIEPSVTSPASSIAFRPFVA